MPLERAIYGSDFFTNNFLPLIFDEIGTEIIFDLRILEANKNAKSASFTVPTDGISFLVFP